MAKMNWEDLAKIRTSLKTAMEKPPEVVVEQPQNSMEKPVVERRTASPEQRRGLILHAAERQDCKTEAIALLGMVGAVEGFTNMSVVYNIPSQTMIDAERMKARNQLNENQARARAWTRLREIHAAFDNELRERGTGYVRPSDWVRIFAVLKKATNPGGNIPNVFAAQRSNSRADRQAFREWANQFGLNGDGLVYAAETIRSGYEDEMHVPFNEQEVIQKIQAFTAEQLNEVVRAGSEADDTYVKTLEGEYVPMKELPRRYDELQMRSRQYTIRADLDRELSLLDPVREPITQDLRDRKYRQILRRYDEEHFHALGVDRNSSGYEHGIVSAVFAAVDKRGGSLTGYGYHGIIEPELLKIVPKEYIVEERGKPYVRQHDGKIVVNIDRHLINKEGIRLFGKEEDASILEAALLKREALRGIADAIVYPGKSTGEFNSQYIPEPYYWNDVHWTYKKLTEERLPFLAKVAGIDSSPIAQFTKGAEDEDEKEDAEKRWMHKRILTSGVSSAKQLDDKKKHFELTIEDVFQDEADCAALHEAEKQFPERVGIGGAWFAVEYEWNADKTSVEKAVIAVMDGGHYSNTYAFKDATPSRLPVFGNAEHPAKLFFRYETENDRFLRRKPIEVSAEHLNTLLRRIEPQEQFLDRKWSDFKHRDEVGKMNIPVIITAMEPFPSPEIMKLVMEGKPEKAVYTVDRDGVEHYAYATIYHKQGDEYAIVYMQTQETADAYLAQSKAKHAERLAAIKAREARGGDEANPEFQKVKALQAEIDAYTKEFETDNLVAFVLGRPPLSADDQKRVQAYIEEGRYESARVILSNAVSERKVLKQELIDNMRKVSAIVTELEALGFDWKHFDVNKQNRRMVDEYGSYDISQTERRDYDGFYPADIKIRNHEVYLPSMGRVVGHELDSSRLRRALPDLLRRLEYQLEIWKTKKEELREEREKLRAASESVGAMPEVIQRGVPRRGEEGEE